jgi:hypothetical protein
MNGRLRSAWMRCAKRIGRRESVKFAEENRASADRGGRPCLIDCYEYTSNQKWVLSHLTKSARLSVYSGLLAKLDTSSSAIEAELDKWDHLFGVGGGYFEDIHLRACPL